MSIFASWKLVHIYDLPKCLRQVSYIMEMNTFDMNSEYSSPSVSVVEIQMEQVILNASSGYLENEYWE